MNEPEDHEQITLFSLDMRLGGKLPRITFPISKSFFEEIGRVVLAWGVMEQCIYNWIVGLAAAGKVNLPERWEFADLPPRLKHFSDGIKATFVSNEEILKFFDSIRGNIDNVRLRRNALIHGRTLISIMANGEIRIQCTDDRTKYSEEFSEQSIKLLGFEIEHISGRLDFQTLPIHKRPGLPSQDRELLRDFAATHLPPLPNPPKPKRQP